MSAPGNDAPSESRSFSQYGEDLILWEFFGEKSGGFFVEIGANHPTVCSNTCFFEQRGWRGIVVEPMPGHCEKLRAARPASQVVQAALGAPGQCGEAVFKLAEAGNPRVDFISLDVEGTELAVLRGFDLARHRPAVLLVEDHWRKPDEHEHLCAGGYRIVRRTGVNSWHVPPDAQAFPATWLGAFKTRLQVGYTLLRRGLRSRLRRLLAGGRDGNPPASQ